MICYNCGQAGHTKFECVEETKGKKCRECGEIGHIQSHCPNKVSSYGIVGKENSGC